MNILSHIPQIVLIRTRFPVKANKGFKKLLVMWRSRYFSPKTAQNKQKLFMAHFFSVLFEIGWLCLCICLNSLNLISLKLKRFSKNEKKTGEVGQNIREMVKRMPKISIFLFETSESNNKAIDIWGSTTNDLCPYFSAFHNTPSLSVFPHKFFGLSNESRWKKPQVIAFILQTHESRINQTFHSTIIEWNELFWFYGFFFFFLLEFWLFLGLHEFLVDGQLFCIFEESFDFLPNSS